MPLATAVGHAGCDPALKVINADVALSIIKLLGGNCDESAKQKEQAEMSNTQPRAVSQRGEVSIEVRPSHGVMEGNGAYNRYAQPQAAGGALASPFLLRAVEKIAFEPSDEPVIIADYGSSQGKNSLAPVGTAIRNLRLRLGA